jgi:hypothetical protein
MLVCAIIVHDKGVGSEGSRLPAQQGADKRADDTALTYSAGNHPRSTN